MKKNIETKGRIFRGILSLIFLSLAGVGYYREWNFWFLILLIITGGFVAFEAIQGWCLARACGIKTKY